MVLEALAAYTVRAYRPALIMGGARSLFVDVPVADVAAAVRFYRAAFEAIPVESTDPALPADAVTLALGDRPGATVLRVFDERTYVAPARTARSPYTKGKVPRMELRVDDVDEWLTRALRAGATPRTRLVTGTDGVGRASANTDQTASYAQFVDPFGHVWALAETYSVKPEP
jgi:uncharacterized glyoxalase superfamily protein PhnB